MKNKNFLKNIEFNQEYIDSCMKKVDKNLKEYINKNIFPKYDLNDKGHNKEHIEFVLKRAFEISKNIRLNYNILYTCVCYHDIACHINREEHEILSANIAYEDKFLNNFFNQEDMKIIKEAIEDHRASSKLVPRNIYGKILSSADRKVEIKNYFVSSLFFGITDFTSFDIDKVIEQSYNHAIKKFGKNGYATKKIYVDDVKYKNFLEDLQYLIENKNEFETLAKIIIDDFLEKN